MSRTRTEAFAYLESEHGALRAQFAELVSTHGVLIETDRDRGTCAAYRRVLREYRLRLRNHTLALRLLYLFDRPAPRR